MNLSLQTRKADSFRFCTPLPKNYCIESFLGGMSGVLNLLIFRDAKNAEHGRIAANWNVSGTRDFQPAVQFCEEFR